MDNMSIPVNIIVAFDQNRGIGKDGQMPWQISADMKHFKTVTTETVDPNKKNAVIMGRVTWDSIPDKFRPLQNRENIVLSRNEMLSLPEGVKHCQSLDQALSVASDAAIEQIFIIGGAQCYQQAISACKIDKLYITHILSSFECDTKFPSFEANFKQTLVSETQQENGLSFYFSQYESV